ncbi:MAG: ABC transporter permease [Rickettsiales bacterium]|nr:MAG: ABC transporter permease [Rickettsiales bacterium]
MIHAIIEIAPSGLLQGLILSLLVLGVMIPFRLLDFPDLSAEGSYPLGGAMCASLIVVGVPPIFALILACLCSGMMGVGTAFVHLRYGVNTLLAGIILSTMIYSVNLRVMGKPNIALFEHPNLFSDLSSGLSSQIIALLIINFVVMCGLFLFLNTEKGLRFRAVGLNAKFAERQGANLKKNITAGLFMGNALCGLAGALLVQIQGYADIGIGVGIVIHALAAMMIGEKMIGTHTTLRMVAAPFIGAILYQQIQGIALAVGMAPSDMKLLTGVIVLGIIALR